MSSPAYASTPTNDHEHSSKCTELTIAGDDHHFDVEALSHAVEDLEAQQEKDEEEELTRRKSTLQIVANYIKYFYSSGLTMAYLALIMWGIWTGKAVLPAIPVVHFIIFIFCLTLVFYLEGLQVAILAVEHNDPEQKKHSHPRAYELIKKVRIGNNVDRFLVGRQFFTVFVMTLIAQVTTFPDLSTLGIPEVVFFFFFSYWFPCCFSCHHHWLTPAAIISSKGSLAIPEYVWHQRDDGLMLRDGIHRNLHSLCLASDIHLQTNSFQNSSEE
jgi:hypothetical protein